MHFEEEYHSNEVPFSSHHIGWTLSALFNFHLAKVVFTHQVSPQLSYFSLLSVFFESKSLSAAHIQGR